MSRKKFSKKGRNRDEVLPGHNISSDITGPISPPSLGGNTYYINFVDECSGYSFGKPIRSKSEAIDEYKIVYALIKTQLDTRSKRLITDGGGEFNSIEMTEFTD
jgi:hypothetical protein